MAEQNGESTPRKQSWPSGGNTPSVLQDRSNQAQTCLSDPTHPHPHPPTHSPIHPPPPTHPFYPPSPPPPATYICLLPDVLQTAGSLRTGFTASRPPPPHGPTWWQCCCSGRPSPYDTAPGEPIWVCLFGEASKCVGAVSELKASLEAKFQKGRPQKGLNCKGPKSSWWKRVPNQKSCLCHTPCSGLCKWTVWAINSKWVCSTHVGSPT